MSRRFSVYLSLLMAIFAVLFAAPKTWAADAALPTGPQLSVLFLGDQGHHRPSDRAAQLIPVFADRGIQIRYTEDVAELNPANLAKYDALLIYANIDRIEPAAEQALLDYVTGGGGLVPLHCASFCFLNSPRYIALVGGQFQRHGTDTFTTNVTAPDHPIMRGLVPFKTWDETYVHHQHNEIGRTVLQTRTEGATEEPWTWVREEGRGRVFYTAYGHDGQTWGNPGFHALVERGIRWAAHKGDVFDSNPVPPTGLKPFEFTAATLPNYTPGAKWGAQGEPIKVMQKPLDPAESQKHLQLPRGFHAALFAAEPEITKPVALAWDHRGRCWIAETVDYPNELQPAGQGRDRIKICEDTDGDGRADKFTVFAEHLSIPTSLMPVRGGLLIHEGTQTAFLKDTDGDDRADGREVLFDGFGVGDTHGGPSNMRWGLDNWVYNMLGYNQFEGDVRGEPVKFHMGFFRFRPDGSKLEFLRNTNNNSWGLGLSEEGLLFGSTANGNPSVYMPIANRYYESVRGWSGSMLGPTAINARFYAVTEKVRQVDNFDQFTAGAGHALYTARQYPRTYWNRTAFVSDPTGHLTATFLLQPRGSDFVSYNSWNLVASDDEWTSPIAAEVGPDGQVWIVDWYNYIIQHNPTPVGFKTGKHAAYETDLRDKTHGRIYRIVYGDDPSYRPLQLDPQNPQQLVATLKNDNMFWRLTAQRVLVERGQTDVAADLIALVNDPAQDAIGLNPAAIHALWTLHGLGLLDGSHAQANQAALAALGHASAGVRRNALQAVARNNNSVEAILARDSLNDPDAQVRLAAFLALAEMPVARRAADAVAAALNQSQNIDDRWIPDAATCAAARHDQAFLRAVAQRPPQQALLPRYAEVIGRVAEHFARGGQKEQTNQLLIELDQGKSAALVPIVEGLARGWPKNQALELTEPAQKALIGVFLAVDASQQSQLVQLAGRWGDPGLQQYTVTIAEQLLALAKDESRSAVDRSDAARRAVELRQRDPAAVKDILALVGPRTDPDLAKGLIDAAGRSDAAEAPQELIAALPGLTPAVRSHALGTLLNRADWTAALLQAIESGAVPLSELSLDKKQALAHHPDAALAERAQKLLAGAGGGLPSPDRQKVIDELSPVVLRSADAVKGQAVFKAQCAKCHVHSGEGNKIGPDLTGMAVHPKAELLLNILDPSRSVEANFRAYTLVTDEGRLLTGLLAAETKTAVEIVDAENKRHTVLRENIDELAASTKSLMPEGFEKQITADDIANLLEFLTQRGKFLPLDLRPVATIVTTKGMFTDEHNDVERLIFEDWAPKEFAGVPFRLVDPEVDRVPNALMLFGPLGKFAPQMPKSVSLPCNAPAKAIHFLSGVAGWAAQGPAPPAVKAPVALIVRLHYADGETEDHELLDGVEFADYIGQFEVPGSRLAFKLRGQQIRYFQISPQRDQAISALDLVKGPDVCAPVVMAVTVETRN